MLRTIIKEPLLHFGVLGALLFVLYGIERGGESDSQKEIVLSAQDIERHIALFERKWQRMPTRDELQGLLENDIREEILYREAIALGLDQHDAIVRRRLAQKMDFISADITDMLQPTDEELQVYLDNNASSFEEPARYSFSHVYLNPDKRGEKLAQDAGQLLKKLQQAPAQGIDTLGDPIMLASSFSDSEISQVSRQFGQMFADALLKSPVGEWHGPIASGYGLHLVLLSEAEPARPVALSEVRDKVEREWRRERREEAELAFYRSLREQYQVVMAPLDDSAVELAEVQEE
ncbi:peptidylprolyl isomerase [Biformimicrobium ophioploci]|uniref:peptidylprolyl isomerase n=1 Tax=Biformimicrobium ophioploci TaxID=3036711 RepID=A0ABQ6LXD2_9GAMM|nr:peptidylprolyl isomerase [Microbulbifer sp. NKW57]GMG86771.1 peptidylprolyl isomerase [Microbulbifer sp. NKW57]